MSKNIRTQLGKIVGKTLNNYHQRVKPKIDDLKFKEQYQGRIIDCMVGEVDDNYIETPEIDSPVVKLEHSKEGLVKVPSIKGKTILIDADGNETDTPGEGCRLVSVGEDRDKIIILSKNKNLITQKDIKELEHGWSDYIPIPNDGRYVLSRGVSTTTPYVRQFTSDKVKKNIDETFGNKRVLDADTGFIRIQYINSISELQLEKGNTPTNYVQHKSHKTEILLDEPLRSLPNGVCDEIIGNKLIRRIGKFTIDGTQMLNVWSNSTGDTVNGYLYYHYFNNLTNVKDYGCVFNAILPSNKGGHTATVEGLRITAYVAFSIHKNKLGIEDVNDYIENEKIVKQWFTNNPTEVLYELEEPIIEELPNGISLQGFDDTTMYIENSITPTVAYGYNALIPYKQELLNQQEEVEINTLDIENNIIPYLLDMEFNLMLMEDN